MNSTVVPLRWIGDPADGYLEMLDQRQLPRQESWMVMSSATDVARGVENMVIRGAPAIGIAAAYGVALAVRDWVEQHRRGQDDGLTKSLEELDGDLSDTFTQLSETRPTAVNLFWALKRMRRELSEYVDELRSGEMTSAKGARGVVEQAFRQAEAIAEEDRSNNLQMAQVGARALDGAAQVLTHCNTGGLATGGFGTALGVVRACDDEGFLERVWIDETRPYLQGARLTTWECLRDNIPATLITDSMAAHFMGEGEVDAVVVGTDRVVANGDVANKIGTYGLAVLADAHDVPFYVAAPISTIDLETESGDDVPIEQRSREEVVEVGDTKIAPEGIDVAHPAFDITPAEYVDGIITERGLVTAPYESGLREIVRETRPPETAVGE